MNGWTLERRRKQAELVRRWKPWEQSTGPKSPEGKATVSGNAWRGGHKEQLSALSNKLNDEIRQSRELLTRI